MLTLRHRGKIASRNMREVARAIAGSGGTICVTGLIGRKVQRLRQAVRGAGVDRTLIRQL